jgi:hypothetical protein
MRKKAKQMERTLCDLKTIAMLKVGDRISQTGGSLVIAHPSVFTALWRSSRGESRYTSIASISSCFVEALSTADEYSLCWKRVLAGGEEEAVCQRLKERAVHLVLEIEMALVGLRNLKNTYCSDLNVQVKLHVLIEKISTQVQIFKDILGLPRAQAISQTHIPTSREILILSLDDM